MPALKLKLDPKTKVTAKAKVKGTAKPAAKEVAASPKREARFLFDAKRTTKFLSRLTAIMGEAENLHLRFRGTRVSGCIVTPKGRLILHNDELIEAGEGTAEFVVPKFIWNNALKNRNQLTLTIDNKSHKIKVAERNYSSELHFLPPEKFDEIKLLEKGSISAKPLQAVQENAGPYLCLSNPYAGGALDVNLTWDKTKVEAHQSDDWHGMYICGPIKGVEPGPVVFTQELFGQLTEIGGELGLAGNNLRIVSDLGAAELAQVAAGERNMPLDLMKTLLDRKTVASFLADAPSLVKLVEAVVGVSEGGKFQSSKFIEMTFTVAPKSSTGKLKIRNTGAHGTVDGSVDISSITGKLPEKLLISPDIIYDLSNLLASGNLSVHIKDRIVQFEPAEKSEWRIAGFAVRARESNNVEI